MTKEKENKEEQAQNIVGLDDDELNEDGESTDEKKPGRLAFLDKYKKFTLPVAIAFGSFVISIVAVKFLAAPSDELSGEVGVEESERSENSGKTKLSMDITEESLESSLKGEKSPADFSIDTSAIMADLAFLDYTPEMEAEEKKQKQKQKQKAGSALPYNSGETSESFAGPGMTPQDSVDTLNWFNKEVARLDKAKIENAKQLKEMKALEYKIDQAFIKIEQAESGRIINLARLYDGMRPKQVGKLFENLDDKAVMAILPRMKSANAAKIMAIMPPKRAARISTKMITVLEQ